MSALGHGAAAVQTAQAGLRVFPVVPGGKKPLRRGWQSTATHDAAVVEAIWADVPEANIGVATGRGLLVVDTDSGKADAAVRELGMPDTVTVKTGCGYHYYLAGRGRNRASLLPGVDIRGDGGYVVGAGSVHPSGAEYIWVVPPWELRPAPVPPELLGLLSEGRRSIADTLPRKIARGARNPTLFRLACSLRGRSGLGYEELLAAVATANRMRCLPPLDGREVERIARSAAGYERAPLWATDPLAFAADPALSGRERLLLMALAHYADDDGACWPGIRRLRADTGLASDTIGKATTALVAARRITVENRRGTSNLYRLLDQPERSPRSPKATESGSYVPPSRTVGAAA